MKVTKADMEVFSKILETEIRKIDMEIALFRHGKKPLDFEEIQSAICNMAMRLPEFWEPGSTDNGEGGVTADLDKPGPTKAPGCEKAIPVEKH